MAENWEAVARAISDRLAATRKTQMDVAARAQVSLTTLRELQHNQNPRRRRPQTLAAISEALDWPPQYLGRVLSGEAVVPAAAAGDTVTRLDAVEAELAALRTRVDALEHRHDET